MFNFLLDQMSDITDDGPRYLLEHLATFSVGNEFGKCKAFWMEVSVQDPSEM